LDEFATVGSGRDVPYSLQLSGSVEIMRPGDKEPVLSKNYQANSNEQVRSALDSMLATLADEITYNFR